ncbi:hypothetical protein ABZX93_10745 [Streptomyces sp. NPDC006632]|uniref:hypothetical protein n=1 Tax=unclassified Streptomyces TaxID=2593676 RepID=UPI002E250FF0
MGRVPGWPDEPGGVHQEGGRREPVGVAGQCLTCFLLLVIGVGVLALWVVFHAVRGHPVFF